MTQMQVLTWNSHHIDERIKDTSAAVKDLQELLALVQGTTKQASDLAADWTAHSLFELKEGQASNFSPEATCDRVIRVIYTSVVMCAHLTLFFGWKRLSHVGAANSLLNHAGCYAGLLLCRPQDAVQGRFHCQEKGHCCR